MSKMPDPADLRALAEALRRYADFVAVTKFGSRWYGAVRYVAFTPGIREDDLSNFPAAPGLGLFFYDPDGAELAPTITAALIAELGAEVTWDTHAQLYEKERVALAREIRLDAGTIGRRIDLRDELDTLDPSRHEGTPLASTSTWVIMAPASVSCAPDGEPVHLW